MQTPADRPRRAPRSALVALATLLPVLTLAGPVSAAGNTLAIAPATTSSVAVGATVAVTVKVTSTVALSGAQASVAFDKSVLQLTKVTRGTAWAAASVFVGGDAAAITAANKDGSLSTTAAAFLPPASVPAGTSDYLLLEFKALKCGTSPLGLTIGALDGQLLDGRDSTYGAALTVTATSGSVGVCGTAASVGSPSATPSDIASASPAGGVAGATGSPTTKLPRTDTLGSAADSGASSALSLALGLLALVAAAAIGLVTRRASGRR